MSDGPVYGDTSRAVLAVEVASISAEERAIVTDVSWRVTQGERVGFFSPNGAGKSTLLSAIAGRRMLEGGRMLVKPGVTVGYLVQTAISGSNLTCGGGGHPRHCSRPPGGGAPRRGAGAGCIADGGANDPLHSQTIRVRQTRMTKRFRESE